MPTLSSVERLRIQKRDSMRRTRAKAKAEQIAAKQPVNLPPLKSPSPVISTAKAIEAIQRHQILGYVARLSGNGAPLSPSESRELRELQKLYPRDPDKPKEPSESEASSAPFDLTKWSRDKIPELAQRTYHAAMYSESATERSAMKLLLAKFAKIDEQEENLEPYALADVMPMAANQTGEQSNA